MIKAKSYGRVVTGAISAYSADASELHSLDAQGKTLVTLGNAANAAVGLLSAAATQIPLVANAPLQWSLVHAPAADTIATATKAAGGAGVRHVLQNLCVGLILITAANFTANQPVYWVVRDGAAGAGTIIFRGVTTNAILSGLNLVGTANTAMTVEWTVAPGLTNLEVISAAGYSIALA